MTQTQLRKLDVLIHARVFGVKVLGWAWCHRTHDGTLADPNPTPGTSPE